eukprot:2238660-Rhodomonas_salina.2
MHRTYAHYEQHVTHHRTSPYDITEYPPATNNTSQTWAAHHRGERLPRLHIVHDQALRRAETPAQRRLRLPHNTIES